MVTGGKSVLLPHWLMIHPWVSKPLAHVTGLYSLGCHSLASLVRCILPWAGAGWQYSGPSEWPGPGITNTAVHIRKSSGSIWPSACRGSIFSKYYRNTKSTSNCYNQNAASAARSDPILALAGELREPRRHPPESVWEQLPWPECVPVKTHLWIHTTYSLWCRSRPAASCPSPSATLPVTVSLYIDSEHRRLAKAIRFNPFGFSFALMLHEQCWY